MAVRREHHRLGAQSEPSVLDCGRQEKSFITGISALMRVITSLSRRRREHCVFELGCKNDGNCTETRGARAMRHGPMTWQARTLRVGTRDSLRRLAVTRALQDMLCRGHPTPRRIVFSAVATLVTFACGRVAEQQGARTGSGLCAMPRRPDVTRPLALGEGSARLQCDVGATRHPKRAGARVKVKRLRDIVPCRSLQKRGLSLSARLRQNISGLARTRGGRDACARGSRGKAGSNSRH